MFYTYELIDPRDGSVFYIGKGTGNRRYNHEKEARAGKLGAKCDRIRAIIAEGRTPQARVVSHYQCEVEAYAAEAKLIAAFEGELTNIASGGRGGKRRISVQEASQRLVRQFHKTMRQAIEAHRAGYKVIVGDGDLIEVAYNVVMGTREKAGEEYFDRIVWA